MKGACVVCEQGGTGGNPACLHSTPSSRRPSPKVAFSKERDLCCLESLDLSCWEVANPSTGDNDNDRDERGLIKLPPSVFHTQIP